MKKKKNNDGNNNKKLGVFAPLEGISRPQTTNKKLAKVALERTRKFVGLRSVSLARVVRKLPRARLPRLAAVRLAIPSGWPANLRAFASSSARKIDCVTSRRFVEEKRCNRARASHADRLDRCEFRHSTSCVAQDEDRLQPARCRALNSGTPSSGPTQGQFRRERPAGCLLGRWLGPPGPVTTIDSKLVSQAV